MKRDQELTVVNGSSPLYSTRNVMNYTFDKMHRYLPAPSAAVVTELFAHAASRAIVRAIHPTASPWLKRLFAQRVILRVAALAVLLLTLPGVGRSPLVSAAAASERAEVFARVPPAGEDVRPPAVAVDRRWLRPR